MCMSKVATILVLLLIFMQSGAIADSAGTVMFGPYEAITIEQEVIRGVKVDEEGKIWILLNPSYRARELILKISEEEGASYRKWYTGNYELISAANQDKVANAWTDWIETKSSYIEYWMGDKKILHLKKVK